MAIREQEDKLFTEWKEHWTNHDAQARNPNLFCADGIVDEDAYLGSSPKLLFLLKEVNGDCEGQGWDLRKFLFDKGGRPATWKNITRWVEGIRQLPNETPWQEIVDINDERRIKALRSIAAINLKKSPGSHTAFWRDISSVALIDKEFLKKQILLSDADVIVCCGTSGTYEWLIPDSPLEWRTTSRGIRYCEPTEIKFVIDYVHPEARVADYLKYYGLIDGLREILMPPMPSLSS
jgi:hypothetical protein